MKRRVVLTLESRATYGYSKNVFQSIARLSELEPLTLVTGMHLIPELGNSIDLIRADGLPISATVPMAPGAERSAWSQALGGAIAGYAEALERLAADIVVISGDRAESLGCCIAAAYMGVPVAHVQAGDKSGHIDDAARMAIAKLAHIHFASCADSADRLRRLGEEEFRIFDVGAPQLDDIVGRDFAARSIRLDGRMVDVSRPYLLLVQHPVMAEREDAVSQLEATLSACLDSGLPIVWIYPNSDLGYRDMLTLIDRYRDDPRIVALPNVERGDYLTLLANAAALVGNSSSGILEAPSFKVPVVNIGERQRGRPQAVNIINCLPERAAITEALRIALNDEAFRRRCAEATNPYGDGRSGERIAAILGEIALDRRLLDKRTVY